MAAREGDPVPHEDWEPQEDWELLLSFLPRNWQELAAQHGALKGLRKNKSAEHLMRVLLLHFGCGHSLQETVVRARQAGLAELSAVALWKRLKKSKDWLHALCGELFRERGVELAANGGPPMRAIDATTIKEPGKTGSLWRLHYSVRLPSLACDYFELTATEGVCTGESLSRIPVQPGDYLLADRGDSTAAGLGRVDAAGGLVTVRVNPGGAPLPDRGRRTVRPAGRGPHRAPLRADAILGRARDRSAQPPRAGPGLRAPQVWRGDAHRASRLGPGGFQQGARRAAADTGIRQVRDRVHHVPGR